MATAVAAHANSGARTLYRPRGPDPLRKLFRQRFPAFQAAYEQRYADIGRLLFDILTGYFTQAVGGSIHAAMVSSHQTFIEFAAWHPYGTSRAGWRVRQP